MKPGDPARTQGPTVRLLNTVAYVIGSVLVVVSVAMAATSGISLVVGETDEAVGIALAAVITGGAGFLATRVVRRPRSLSVKEGFATVGLAWFVISAFGMLPYLLTGHIPDLTNAFFETVSGFTTTGASILPDPSLLPIGLGLWRALTQWIGGMGVILLGVAILPLLGTGGVLLARAEYSDPSLDRLTPRYKETAKRLWLLYGALTVVVFAFLAIGDMSMYQAVIHAMTTMPTGGFSTEATSLAGFSAYSQWVVTVFMVVAGVSFVLHFRALRKPGEYLRSAEFRLYITFIVVAVVLVAGGLLADRGLEPAVRESAFNAVSLITTTGYSNADFGAWRPALQVLAVGLMFLGGMAGSTAGSVKTWRWGVLAKAAFADLRRLVHPRGVFITRFGRTKVSDPVVEAVQSYFLFFMAIFMTSVFLVTFIDANILEELDLVTATSAVTASLGNIGPGLGEVGPASNYLAVPGLAKWLLAALMIVGRLELFPVLVLFTKDLWRR